MDIQELNAKKKHVATAQVFFAVLCGIGILLMLAAMLPSILENQLVHRESRVEGFPWGDWFSQPQTWPSASQAASVPQAGYESQTGHESQAGYESQAGHESQAGYESQAEHGSQSAHESHENTGHDSVPGAISGASGTEGAYSSSSDYSFSYDAVILWGKGTNLRSGPGQSYPVVSVTAETGERAVLLEYTGEWCEIMYKSYRVYVYYTLVTFPRDDVLTLKERAPYFDKPYDKEMANVLGYLSPDEQYHGIGYTYDGNGWYCILYKDRMLYVPERYVRV